MKLNLKLADARKQKKKEKACWGYLGSCPLLETKGPPAVGVGRFVVIVSIGVVVVESVVMVDSVVIEGVVRAIRKFLGQRKGCS